MKTPSDPRALTLRSKHKPSSKQAQRRPGKRPEASAELNGGGGRKKAAKKAAPVRAKLQLPVLNAGNLHASPKFGCAECGLCCTYVAIEVDGPSTAKRATELLWYLYHQEVSLYVNDDDWMVQFETTCRFLTADRRCGVYATRPHICREFSDQDCEINTGDDGHTFYTPAAFMDYLKQTRPRVHAHVMKGYAPPEERNRGLHPFERRQQDVYVRRAKALTAPQPPAAPARTVQPRAATRTALPVKKSRGGSASADTL